MTQSLRAADLVHQQQPQSLWSQMAHWNMVCDRLKYGLTSIKAFCFTVKPLLGDLTG